MAGPLLLVEMPVSVPGAAAPPRSKCESSTAVPFPSRRVPSVVALPMSMDMSICAIVKPKPTVSLPTIPIPKSMPVHINRWQQLRRFVRILLGYAREDAEDQALAMRRRKLPHRLLLHRDFWLEAIDRTHRYGFHLRAFHAIWMREMESSSSINDRDRSFFYWLDHGAGKMCEVPECSRHALWSTRVLYCASAQRDLHEVGFLPDQHVQHQQHQHHRHAPPRLAFLHTRELVHTDSSSKWMFVMGVDARMFVARKEKGHFHHTSFHAGAPIASAGKIYVEHGQIRAVEPHSGHFKPRLANLLQMCRELEAHGVVMSTVRLIKPRKWSDEWPFASERDQ